MAVDFVDVESRSRKIASIEVQAAQDKLSRLDNRTKFITTIFTAAAAVLGVLGTVLVGWLTGMQSVRSDVNDLKSKVDIVQLKNEVRVLTNRVTALESKQQGNRK